MATSPSRWQPGQLLFVGFAGTKAPRPLLEAIRAGRIGGAILFRRNIESPAQVRALCDELHAAAPADAPLLIAIDQEGGRVQRLREPFTVWPPMRRVGELGDLATTAAVAEALAVELGEHGIDLDFAPVVDVDTNPQNPVIGDRSFGRTAAQVSAHGAAFIKAMQARGVAACAKHFPGHGDTISDSHLELPRLEHDLDRLREVELPPFAAAAAAGVATMMTAHVLFPRLDRKRPATLSPDIMALLRGEIGYEGLVFSDDLEMKAVADHFSIEERTLGPLEAGVDALLVCSQWDLAEECLRLLERAPDRLIEHGLRRMVALKEAYGRTRRPVAVERSLEEIERAREEGARGPAGPPYADHQALAERIARPG
ncbi:MAG: beta-N-acetylhexosaminidase [Myxococcales bacterium]|nr:beta-N-acetylhexosaminidase [Myxococcales bacterium]